MSTQRQRYQQEVFSQERTLKDSETVTIITALYLIKNWDLVEEPHKSVLDNSKGKCRNLPRYSKGMDINSDITLFKVSWIFKKWSNIENFVPKDFT